MCNFWMYCIHLGCTDWPGCLYNHALFIALHRPALVSVLASVHTFPWHRVRHRNFLFGIHMHICPQYMHIKYLVVLTCIFQMAAILVFFFDLLSCPYRQSETSYHIYLCFSTLPTYTKEKMPLLPFF